MSISSFGLWAIGVYYSFLSNSIWDTVWNGYDTVFTLINVVCIYILCLNYTREKKVVRLVSSNTLGIYLIHELLTNLTKAQVRSIDVICNVPCSLLYTLLILFASLAITLMLKKTPILRLLFS